MISDSQRQLGQHLPGCDTLNLSSQSSRGHLWDMSSSVNLNLCIVKVKVMFDDVIENVGDGSDDIKVKR